jgi:hypothetical protein
MTMMNGQTDRLRQGVFVACLLASSVFFVSSLASAAGAPQPAAAQAKAIPRTAAGKPDFSGFWQAMNTANYDILPRSASKDGPAGLGVVEGGVLPYTAAGLAKKKENQLKREELDTEAKCYLPGVPRIMYMPFPFQIVQTPALVMMLFEYVHAVRNIYIDKPHPRGPIEWWMGDSRAKWEGDTLVVDVVHFNADTWFDRAGNHHSEEMHVVERYSFMDADHINYSATIEDPKVFTKPWKMNMVLYRHKEPNFQLLDYECYAFELDEEPIVPPPPKP